MSECCFPYSVLLVTTGSNHVRRWLSMHCACLEVIDCAGLTRCVLFARVSASRAPLLLAYRCPWLLPSYSYACRPLGAYNIHPSLLPLYAGLNPWEAMRACGETRGGVTIHRLSSVADAGELVLQQAFPLDFTRGLEANREQADLVAAGLVELLLGLLD